MLGTNITMTVKDETVRMPRPFGLAVAVIKIIFPPEERRHKMPSTQDIMLEGRRWALRDQHNEWNKHITRRNQRYVQRINHLVQTRAQRNLLGG